MRSRRITVKDFYEFMSLIEYAEMLKVRWKFTTHVTNEGRNYFLWLNYIPQEQSVKLKQFAKSLNTATV